MKAKQLKKIVITNAPTPPLSNYPAAGEIFSQRLPAAVINFIKNVKIKKKIIK